MKLFITVSLWLWPLASFALIDYHTIMSRTADNHGRGVYQIEQDVVFHQENESFSVRESWLIGGEGAMRVSLEGRGSLRELISGIILYDQSQRKTKDENGSLRTTSLPDSWMESFFSFRYSKNIKPKLVALKIAPPESLRERSVIPGAEYKYGSQDFVRLARSGGVTNYAISNNTTDETLPGLWIEQDQFVVRKVRLPNLSTVTAGDYLKYTESLMWPKVRTYTWGAYTVKVHTVSVKALGQNKSADLFKTSQLEVPLKLSEAEVIREFYKKFR